MANVNGTLYFRANDGTNGNELWRINATGQAEMVDDSVTGGGINPGSAGSDPTFLTVANATLYFQATDGTNGIELWRIDASGQAVIVEDGVVGGGIKTQVDANTIDIPLAGLTSLDVRGGEGDDSLILDFTNGNPIPPGGVNFDGGSGGMDSLTITGGSATEITHTFFSASDGQIVTTIDGGLHGELRRAGNRSPTTWPWTIACSTSRAALKRFR
jgi:ELWxxDGT repeat protein